MHDLIIIGANASGISLAVRANQAGINNVRLVTQRSETVYPELLEGLEIDVSFKERALKISKNDDVFTVETDKQIYTTRCVMVAPNFENDNITLPESIALGERVLQNQIPEDVSGKDILVVGNDDTSVELAAQLIRQGANVVLASKNLNPKKLSFASNEILARLEQQRKITVFYRSSPNRIETKEDFPMVFFEDRRTPDLEFDYVLYTSKKVNTKSYVEVDELTANSSEIIFAGELSSAEIEERVSEIFGGIEFKDTKPQRNVNFEETRNELRKGFYNATITYFEPTHSDLWVLRVRPDNGDISHKPGQYSTLGLGYFEDRIDDAIETDIDDRWDKLVRRAYSISNRIFTDDKYLATTNGADVDELEFYIVLVPPTPGNVPGLTPRLALKRPGDRIFLGPKVAGRYTLAPITDPNQNVLLLSTGTGEAPHNSMIVELLGKGHTGQITSVVSVRNLKDLGYIDKHQELEKRYSNYKYIPLPTREVNIPKRYIQDLLKIGVIEDEFGVEIDPSNTHVFLCGNPSMIGKPEEQEGVLIFPETSTPGAIELLLERGFKIDSRKNPGTIHVEEYW